MGQENKRVLTYVVHEPSEDNGFLYELEVIELPGCRTWGATEAEALDCLYDVAGIFLDSYREQGKPLPGKVEEEHALELVPAA